MIEELSEENIRKILSVVMHPAIDRSLLDLGIIEKIITGESRVIITLALPFSGIPKQIEDFLVQSVQEPIKNLGHEVEVKTTVMNQEALQKFLAMEKEAWGI
ncbi:MAG: hypothetical protein AEth_01202 [Candidatus Argoarchaeum ethanivorans]|uniref:MIP18 family-like domain-containing protein n=1 Tax=Candidatus Argoarchaeum ethanivorans TaxID=2608793 RepID=A0A8B3S1M9_9EURY|nr:MAG: hypothetical protein AEth_01202 [Candidatus Argoarchaeum ethanivorans]